MPKFSIIVPVYNRPDEIRELLQSLSDQSFTDFEVIIVEDGSETKCDKVVQDYASSLDLHYYFKENSGQGFSRNYGREKAKGTWLIFFDSDCVIPSEYFENLDRLTSEQDVQAFCGPDAARQDFSVLQKAISYSMTSILTTGGIRGKKVKVDREAHLRSYNLVIQADIYDQLEGFAKTNMGEDMELSSRFRKNGYHAEISDLLTVFHKRRNTLGSFFRQVFSFGRTRVQLKRGYDIPIKTPHLFPSIFTIGMSLSMVGYFLDIGISGYLLAGYGCYFLSILIHATYEQKSVLVGIMSVITSLVQHVGYGLGFLQELLVASKS